MSNSSLYNGINLSSPLSEEDTNLHFKLYNEGSKESFDILVVHNIRLVIYIASKFQNTDYEIEDLASIGSIGLIKAIKTFDIDKNIKFATYASRCIENEILMFLRRKKAYVSFDETIAYDGNGAELKVIDTLSEEDLNVTSMYEIIETKDELIKAYNTLTEREKDIIYWLYICETKKYTQEEIAKIYGLSQSYISRIKKMACRKMATYISEQSGISSPANGYTKKIKNKRS